MPRPYNIWSFIFGSPYNPNGPKITSMKATLFWVPAPMPKLHAPSITQPKAMVLDKRLLSKIGYRDPMRRVSNSQYMNWNKKYKDLKPNETGEKTLEIIPIINSNVSHIRC